MNNLHDMRHQTATTKPGIEPALRATIPREYTNEQIEAASCQPSPEAIFAAHLKLLALQDTEWPVANQRAASGPNALRKTKPVG